MNGKPIQSVMIQEQAKINKILASFKKLQALDGKKITIPVEIGRAKKGKGQNLFSGGTLEAIAFEGLVKANKSFQDRYTSEKYGGIGNPYQPRVQALKQHLTALTNFRPSFDDIIRFKSRSDYLKAIRKRLMKQLDIGGSTFGSVLQAKLIKDIEKFIKK